VTPSGRWIQWRRHRPRGELGDLDRRLDELARVATLLAQLCFTSLLAGLSI